MITVGWNSSPVVQRIMRKFRDETDQAGAENITGWTIKLIVKRLATDEDADAIFDLQATLVTPTSGVYKYTFTPEHTAIQPGSYFAEERWWKSSPITNKPPSDRRPEAYVVSEPVQRGL